MTNQELKSLIIFINKIIASNNPRAAVTVLKRYGYETQYDILSADQIEKALLELYVADPTKYVSVIKEIPYREDITNWTTSPQTKEQIKSVASQLNVITSSTAKFDLAAIWQGIKDGIGNTITQVGGGGTVTTQPALKAGVVILIAVIGIIAIVLILRFTKQTA